MTRFRDIRNNFVSGEISPKLRMRTDISEYKTGASEVLNMIPATTGGAFTRMSTRFLNNVFKTTVDTDSLLDNDDVTKKAAMFELPVHSTYGPCYLIIRPMTALGSGANIILTIFNHEGLMVKKLAGSTATNDTSISDVPSSVVDNPGGWHSTRIKNYVILTHTSGRVNPCLLYTSPSPRD